MKEKEWLVVLSLPTSAALSVPNNYISPHLLPLIIIIVWCVREYLCLMCIVLCTS